MIVWQEILAENNISRAPTGLKEVITGALQFRKGKSLVDCIYKLSLAAAVYCLCGQRNSRIFRSRWNAAAATCRVRDEVSPSSLIVGLVFFSFQYVGSLYSWVGFVLTSGVVLLSVFAGSFQEASVWVCCKTLSLPDFVRINELFTAKKKKKNP